MEAELGGPLLCLVYLALAAVLVIAEVPFSVQNAISSVVKVPKSTVKSPFRVRAGLRKVAVRSIYHTLKALDQRDHGRWQ